MIMTLSQFKTYQQGRKKHKPSRRIASPKKLLINKPNAVKYNGVEYNIGQPKRSNREGKKYMVEVEYQGRKKTVHWGAKGYQDYLTHKDENRRKRFQARHRAIKMKDGSIAANNPLQPAYYSTKYNW